MLDNFYVKGNTDNPIFKKEFIPWLNKIHRENGSSSTYKGFSGEWYGVENGIASHWVYEPDEKFNIMLITLEEWKKRIDNNPQEYELW